MITEQHIEQSISNAILGISNITEKQLSVDGFSTPTMRHLWNNLCCIDGIYLECGLFKGGTFVASFNKNCQSIGIEDYSQPFGESNVKSILEENIEANKGLSKECKVHFEDCFSIDKEKLPSNIDILFFDAEHSEESQSKALPYFFNNMSNTFLYIADDAHWKSVIDGTANGLFSLKDKIRIDNTWCLSGHQHNDDPIWHNGIVLFLISKK